MTTNNATDDNNDDYDDDVHRHNDLSSETIPQNAQLIEDWKTAWLTMAREESEWQTLEDAFVKRG